MILHMMSRKLRKRYIILIACIFIMILILESFKKYHTKVDPHIVLPSRGTQTKNTKKFEAHEQILPTKWIIAFANNSDVCIPLVTHFHDFNVLTIGPEKKRLGHSRCFFFEKSNFSSYLCGDKLACDRSYQLKLAVLYLQQFQPSSILMISASLDTSNLQKYDLLHTPPESNTSVSFDDGPRVFPAISYYGCNISENQKEGLQTSHRNRYRLCSFPEASIQAYAFVGSFQLFSCDKTMPPVVLMKHQYSHFYQDNIYIGHDAIWSLGLIHPNCFTRDCLLIEYVIQRLLWLIGASLRLVNVEIIHAPYLKDTNHMEEEFQQIREYLSLIDTWNCSRMYFKDCIIDIATYLQTKSVTTDVSYIVKWVGDLEKAGYIFPALKDIDGSFVCKSNMLNLVPVNYNIPPPDIISWRKVKTPINDIKSSQKLHSDLCQTMKSTSVNLNQPWVQFDDVILLVVFNNPTYEAIPYIEIIYASFFPHILYCGPVWPEPSDFPHLFTSGDNHNLRKKFLVYHNFQDGQSMHANGSFSYACLQMAIQVNFNVKGYLIVADDAILWIHKLAKLPKDMVWFIPQSEIRIGELRSLKECKLGMCDFHPHWDWWEWYQKATIDVLQQMKAMQDQSTTIYECYHQLILLNGAELRANGGFSDVFYVPQRLFQKFAFLSELFLENRVFVEIAVPTILRCIESPENIQPLSGIRNWDIDTRDKPWMFFSYQYIIKNTYYHPVKWSYIQKGNQTREFQDYLCNKLLPFMFDPYQRLH